MIIVVSQRVFGKPDPVSITVVSGLGMLFSDLSDELPCFFLVLSRRSVAYEDRPLDFLFILSFPATEKKAVIEQDSLKYSSNLSYYSESATCLLPNLSHLIDKAVQILIK